MWDGTLNLCLGHGFMEEFSKGKEDEMETKKEFQLILIFSFPFPPYIYPVKLPSLKHNLRLLQL